MKRLGFLWVVLILFLGGAIGCRNLGPKFDPRAGAVALTNLTSVARTNLVDTQWLQPNTNAFTLGPGDSIDIELFGEEPIRGAATVGPDGKIYFYLLPGLSVWGLTLAETAELLEQELARYVNSPEVGVTLRAIESKQVWLLGRFRRPGVYPLTAPTTVLEALSLAGGAASSSASGTTQELADLRNAFIIRGEEMIPVNFDELLRKGDLSQNIYLQADDFVYLPSATANEIFVLGAVRSPRAVPYTGAMTVASVIAAAGGTLKDAYETDVAVVRGSLSEPKVAIVNFKAITRGNTPDVLLEPRDIVFVPKSPYSTLNRYLDLIVTTFVRAVAVNEGARAVSENVGAVGVGINISPFPVGPTLAPGTTPPPRTPPPQP